MIWSGWGWLGYFVIIVFLLGPIFLTEAIAGPNFFDDNPWLAVGSFSVSSVLCWFIGRWFNRGLPIRVLGYHSIHQSRTEGHTTFIFRLEFAWILSIPLYAIVLIFGHKALGGDWGT